MKLKRLAAFAMAGAMVVSLAACGGKTEEGTTDNNTQGAAAEEQNDGIISYAD